MVLEEHKSSCVSLHFLTSFSLGSVCRETSSFFRQGERPSFIPIREDRQNCRILCRPISFHSSTIKFTFVYFYILTISGKEVNSVIYYYVSFIFISELKKSSKFSSKRFTFSLFKIPSSHTKSIIRRRRLSVGNSAEFIFETTQEFRLNLFWKSLTKPAEQA